MPKYISTIIAVCVGFFAAAQVQVRSEPRHHNVFENEYVRILDVYIPPYDTTQFHIHSTPSVFLSFTKTITNAQLMGKPAGKSNLSVPARPYYDSLGTPRIHRVWNEDSIWFHVMDIELTAGTPKSNEPQIQSPSLTCMFSRFLANGYTLQLKAKDNFELPASSAGYLLVSEENAVITYTVNNSIQQRIMKAGHYIWVESGKLFSITMNENKTGTFMILQLK